MNTRMAPNLLTLWRAEKDGRTDMEALQAALGADAACFKKRRTRP